MKRDLVLTLIGILKKVESHIDISRDFNIRNTENWDDAIKWHLNMAHEFYFEFTTWIKLYRD